MEDICSVCFLYPDSHSFKLIKETEMTCVFYTCVSEAKRYNDTEGIIKHYKNLLDKYENKLWIWIFDCKNLGLKHCMNVNIPIQMIKMLKKGPIKRLKKVMIINKTNFIEILLKIVLPFMTDEEKDLIKIY